MYIYTQPFWVPNHTCPVPDLQFSFGLNQVSIKGDVSVKVITEDGIFPLAFKESDPDFVISLKLQHQALALHDGAVTGLGIKDHHLSLIVHHMQVCLLLVPCMHIEAEVVDPGHVTVELTTKHVEVTIEVDQLCVKYQCLVVVIGE